MIPYIDKCSERVWVGSSQSLNYPDELKAAGITAILNVADDFDHSSLIKSKFKCATVPLHENWRMGFDGILVRGAGRNPPEMIMIAVEVIHHLAQAGNNVLVHCVAGCHRSPAIIALYSDNVKSEGLMSIWSRFKTFRPGIRNFDEVEFFEGVQ